MVRSRGRRLRDLRRLGALAKLPRSVAVFQWHAWRLAERLEDEFALVSGTRPRDLAVLLDLARGASRVVELGTGSAWTTMSLALANHRATVVSYDPHPRPNRDRYIQLAQEGARRRIRLVRGRGDDGPDDNVDVELLYVDSAHERENIVREVDAWRPVMMPGSAMVFDDYAHEGYPGVKEAVCELNLDGEQRGTLFVHRVV